jgi:APA family basic amino acid/polyamine antiporter
MSGSETTPGGAEHGLKKTLGTGFVLAVVVGGVIGLGILRTPGEIATVVPDPLQYLSLWVLGGAFVLLSTVVTAELVGMTPRSGGTYPLVRHAYGPYSGFVIGWVDWLSFVADIALKAVVVMEFVALLLPATAPWQTALAIAVTSLFAALQLRGVALGAAIQQIATAAIGLIIVGLSLALFVAEPTVVGEAASAPAAKTGIRAWSLVAATIIFTYDGWLYAAYFSGEIKQGGGAIARTCVKGLCVVIALYLLLNASIVWSIPLPIMAGNELALARALELAISPTAAGAVVVAAILILLSHQNLGYLGASRILHALAVDGLALKRAQTVGRGGNPVFAVLATWLLSVGLILIGGFESLLHLCVFFFVIIYLVLIAGVAILRRREPESDRPYRAWGHPYSTAVCAAGWTIITLFQAVAEPETALYAVIMVAVSWPVYWLLVNVRPGLGGRG